LYWLVSSAKNAAGIEMATREPRGSRRRPDVAPPKVERIPPRSGLSRAEVIVNQRRRIFEGLAAALAYHGYEDTKITDVVELSGVSRATFYERFESKEGCFAAAYEDGVERLGAAVEAAAQGEDGWDARLSAGLRAGLEFLAADPPLAHLLLVEALAAARPARLEHERSLERLAEALRPPAELPGGERVPEETVRLLAGGLASHLSGRVLAGEAECLDEDHDLLLGYLLAPTLAADARVATG
jgi:AcrR family transcriptional regulator